MSPRVQDYHCNNEENQSEKKIRLCLILSDAKFNKKWTLKMIKMKSKLVIITGSAGGLGKAFAERLLSLGEVENLRFVKYFILLL